MPSLNELEKAVLEQMVRQVPDDVGLLLREQIDGAEVVSRRNSGVGFFTDLKVEKISGPILLSPITGVGADIEGFAESMVFVLFFKDGIIDMLEGATIDDSTVGIDFSKVRFTIIT